MDLFPIRFENKKVLEDVLRQMRSIAERGAFILSDYVNAFEKDFASSINVRYALGVNSGTDALMLALKALGVGKGDEVIVPAFTFISTAFAVLYLGARPVFADIDPDTFNLMPSEIGRLCNKKTKAVICVHLFGNSCDMDSIMDVSRENNLYVVEDAAQAHFGRYVSPSGSERFLGTIGDIGAFSFYPTKNLGAWGDAGMVVCKSSALYGKMKVLRDLGRDKFRYRHDVLGFNTRLDALQAVVLRNKLKFLENWTMSRRKIADFYRRAFTGKLRMQKECAYSVSSYHSFAVLPKSRKKLQCALEKSRIPFAIYYPLPLHKQPVFKKEYGRLSFPNAERISKRIINLPIHPFLSKSDLNKIVEAVLENA